MICKNCYLVILVDHGSITGWRHRTGRVECSLMANTPTGCYYCLTSQPRYQEKGMTCPQCGTHGSNIAHSDDVSNSPRDSG